MLHPHHVYGVTVCPDQHEYVTTEEWDNRVAERNHHHFYCRDVKGHKHLIRIDNKLGYVELLFKEGN